MSSGDPENAGSRLVRHQSGPGPQAVAIDALNSLSRLWVVAISAQSAVRPAARFGELEMDGVRVSSFQEKPQLHDGWINGGYFVFEPAFFDLIADDITLLEREPLELASKAGELMAYRHNGFWHCMDTKRDHELLESLWAKGAPWAV